MNSNETRNKKRDYRGFYGRCCKWLNIVKNQ